MEKCCVSGCNKKVFSSKSLINYPSGFLGIAITKDKKEYHISGFVFSGTNGVEWDYCKEHFENSKIKVSNMKDFVNKFVDLKTIEQQYLEME